MYSIKWAEKVLSAYMESNPRALNMPRVITAATANLLDWETRPNSVERHLIASIAGRGNKRLWPDFKRLCKHSPLDARLLEKVCRAIYWPEHDEWKQYKFDFECEKEWHGNDDQPVF